jgi:site-specific DNA-methyltransferase (adenine-specific)
MLESNAIYQGDCLEVMQDIADGSVDMILCDLPYGTTCCKWDCVIPFEPLWEQYKRLIKRNGAIVLTASQPFTTDLICSNRAWFKYCWVWEKSESGNFQMCNVQPLRITEDVLVFCNAATQYNPQGLRKLKEPIKKSNVNKSGRLGHLSVSLKLRETYLQTYTGYPVNILRFGPDSYDKHPTQKPVALFEYLIRTYTNEGETVLDNCAGSGTTGLACLNSNRNFILIEKEPEYCEIARERMALWGIPLVGLDAVAV